MNVLLLLLDVIELISGSGEFVSSHSSVEDIWQKKLI